MQLVNSNLPTAGECSIFHNISPQNLFTVIPYEEITIYNDDIFAYILSLICVSVYCDVVPKRGRRAPLPGQMRGAQNDKKKIEEILTH